MHDKIQRTWKKYHEIALFLLQILFATIYSTIIFIMTDQPWEWNRYTRFTLVYVLVTIVADGLGLLLGAIANPVVSIFELKIDSSDEWRQLKIVHHFWLHFVQLIWTRFAIIFLFFEIITFFCPKLENVKNNVSLWFSIFS